MPISWRPRRGMDDILRKLTGKDSREYAPARLADLLGWDCHYQTDVGTVKRVLDITFSIAELLSAAFIVFAVACIKLDSKGPILFRQERGGDAWYGVHTVQIPFDASGC